MRFWDSSALVPLLVSERASAAVTEVLASDQAVVVWWSTSVECVSAIARLERDGDLPQSAAADAVQRLDVLQGSWSEVQPVEVVRRTAKRLLRMHPIRTADALQLAAALVASENDPSSLTFVSLDGRLAEAARKEGLVVEVPA